jgi:hypothetical protein
MSYHDEDANVDVVRIVGSTVPGSSARTESLAVLNLSIVPHLPGGNTYQFRVYPQLDAPDRTGPGPLALAILKRILTG